MAEPTNTIPTPAPAAKPATKVVSYTPLAFRKTLLRENMVNLLKNFKPDGNPDPELAAHAAALALEEIGSLPSEINAVELIIEANASIAARQVNVIVFPKKL